MRLEKYVINEAGRHTRVEHETMDQLGETIRRDCKPYLNEFGAGRWVYRGYRFTYKDRRDKLNILRNTPRKDRASMNMPDDIQNYIDDMFKKKFGWRPRKEGVFTTNRGWTAMDYGNSQIFLPIGNYKYIFNPQVDDLYMMTPRESVRKVINKEGMTPDMKERYEKWQDSLEGFRNNGLSPYLGGNVGSEVIWDCKAYYMVDSDLDMGLYRKDYGQTFSEAVKG